MDAEIRTGMKIFFLAMVIFVPFGFFLPDHAMAQVKSAGGEGPIHITSDRMEAMDQAGKVVFLGNVVSKRGDLVIHSDQLDVFYQKAAQKGGEGEDLRRSIEKMVATGHVRITSGPRTATGEKAVYERRSETITIIGSAQVWEGQNRVSGETIILYMNEDRSVVQSGGKGKVEAIVYPDEEAEKRGR